MDLKILAYSSLLCYCAAQWPKYQVTPFHQMIAEHLEAVERGEITRLLLNVPPRHGKTLLVGINFPAWFLGRNPESEIIYASYSGERAEDVGREVRNQLTDPLHGRIFKECSISSDSASVKKIGVGQKGAYYAVGVGGPIVGRGANVFIIDDPIKDRQEADSAARRRFIKNWYQGVAYTRLQPQNAIILIQHRWHDDDLAGWLIREHQHENWTILKFPALASSEQDLLGREIGEALWPEAFPKERLEHTKQSVGTREWSALYQQTPIIAGGGIINLEWFRRYKPDFGIKEKVIRTVQSWDTAYKKDKFQHAPSVCTTWKVTKVGYYLWNVFRKRMEYPELKRSIITQHRRYEADAVLIEDRASGQSLLQEFRGKIPVIAIMPITDKVTRMSVESSKIESGMVILPEDGSKPWLVDYESELGIFPYSATNDQADSTSQFLAWISKRKIRKHWKERYWK